MKQFIFVFLLLALGAACGSEDDTGSNCTSSSPIPRVLDRYYEIIDNRITNLAAAGVRLESLADGYVDSPSEVGLQALRAQYLLTAEAWLNAEPFAYGPDGASVVSMEVNPFPVDETAVDAHVAQGSFDKSQPANFDRGLPALDYLLFNGTLQEVHQRLLTNGAARLVIFDLSEALQTNMTDLANTWKDSQESFIASTGTSAGSSISVLINGLSKHFEDTRRDRLGTPFGVTTLGFANPQTVEAPYSEQSLTWLRLAIIANQTAFLASDPVGEPILPSLADYIQGLPSADATTLADDIQNQYTLMLAALDEVDGPLATAVEQDVDDVQEAYNTISRQVVNLKTDVPAVACVAITYVDNPSDSD